MILQDKASATILGASIFLGLAVLGYFLGSAAIDFKEYERSVTVKGLSEREVPADIVIWPIVFTEADNDLGHLYESIEISKKRIEQFLIAKGIESGEISHSLPAITDKSAQQYGSGPTAEFRYVASQTVTVYSSRGIASVKRWKNCLNWAKAALPSKGEIIRVRSNTSSQA